MEGHELRKYLLEMLRRYPRMATQFTRPNMQYDLLYDAEYNRITEYATCLQCNTGRLVHQERKQRGYLDENEMGVKGPWKIPSPALLHCSELE